MKRIYSIDLMRGIVVVIMTLDHVRDLLHTTALMYQPTDLTRTEPALFFTRWVTHLCAPTFVFLSGASAFLSMQRNNDVPAARWFLLKRGLWLMVLDLTLINFGIWWDVGFHVFFFNVVAAIGFGFVVLALLSGCRTRTIAIIGIAILLLHNLAPLVPGDEMSFFKRVLMPLFAPKAFPLPAGRFFVVGYPPIPWLGIMLVGFAAGRLFLLESHRQRTLFLRMGAVCIGLFFLLRMIDVYGDGVPWSLQKNRLFTFLSFINLTKYPPSLDFCLLFLGAMFLILSIMQKVRGKWTDAVCVYGKVPLFYFVVHWYVIHPLMFLMLFLQGFKGADMVFGFNFGRPKAESGLALWGVYVVWIGIVIAMFPLCKWYGRYKEQHKDKQWLRYL
jgi:uncharacterized membrane protein